MKSFKRFAAVTTAIAMLISIMPTELTAFAKSSSADENDKSYICMPPGVCGFGDVSPNAWYASAVDYVYSTGIMSGTSAYKFEPEKGVTRAMTVQILYKLSGAKKTENVSKFTDVKDGEWYTDAVNWAVVNGIASGYSDGTFKPSRAVTREEFSSLLYRYAGSPEDAGMILQEYDDYSSMSDFAKPSLRWCVHNGLLFGIDEDRRELAPKKFATRGQLASIIMRYMELNQ